MTCCPSRLHCQPSVLPVPCCAVLCCDICRSMGFSGTILRSNLHESRELVRLPDVRTAVQHANLVIWPWVSTRWTLIVCNRACCPHLLLQRGA
jgi:hypothetical protein